MPRRQLEEDGVSSEPEQPQSHDFLVIDVQPAPSDGSIAVTLVDVRGGRVTLHLDGACAALLRDIIDDQLN